MLQVWTGALAHQWTNLVILWIIVKVLISQIASKKINASNLMQVIVLVGAPIKKLAMLRSE